jgi:leucyl-tRNA---protein transferase
VKHLRQMFYAQPARCEYLPDRFARLEFIQADDMTREEYLGWLRNGWRRFGNFVFRPACHPCRMCQSLRVPVASFQPRRTQRRIWKSNSGVVSLAIGEPTPSVVKRRLYHAFHQHQHVFRGWPAPDGDALDSFADNPFPTEEWCYFIGDTLVGVGYVDALADGLSAIYFFHDPDERRRSLGTFNVLSIIDEARRRQLPWVYLGYYVKGCQSVEYKGRFMPNEVLAPGGDWTPFLKG